MSDAFNTALSLYRKGRVFYRRVIGTEPTISVTQKCPLHYHGNKGYGGWAIPDGVLNTKSVVVDVGLGEDISFSESLIEKYECRVHGFDPTPKSIAYVQDRAPRNFQLHKTGVAGSNRTATFFLPNNPTHVSGSTTKSNHVGDNAIDVNLIDMDSLLRTIGENKIDLLKIDIEGSEFELIDSSSFQKNAENITILCVEFHHRWPEFGSQSTYAAVQRLKMLGFACVWRAHESNEEFTFMNTNKIC